MRPPVVRLRLIRPAELKRRYSPAVLRDRFQQNLGLRIISLLLAVGLWIFVNAGQHSSVEPFNIPVSYRGLPPGFVITNEHPDFVKIQISGPQTLLSLVDPSRLTLKLDLSGVGVGQASFKIGLDSFNVPRGTAVTSILPSQIVLDVRQDRSPLSAGAPGNDRSTGGWIPDWSDRDRAVAGAGQSAEQGNCQSRNG